MTNSTNTITKVDLMVAALLIIVIGLTGGYMASQPYQQNIEAHSNHVVRWTYKKPAPLKRNPNCRLYSHDACPFDTPIPPTQESILASTPLA